MAFVSNTSYVSIYLILWRTAFCHLIIRTKEQILCTRQWLFFTGKTNLVITIPLWLKQINVRNTRQDTDLMSNTVYSGLHIGHLLAKTLKYDPMAGPPAKLTQLSLIEVYVHQINCSREYTLKEWPPLFLDSFILPLRTGLQTLKSPGSISKHYLFKEEMLKGFVLLNMFLVHAGVSSQVTKTRKKHFKVT